MARGHIQKRGNNYSIAIYLGKDTNGKKKYKWYTVKGTKKDAESFLNKKLNELESGTLIVNDKITVSEYLDYWYSEYCEKKLAKSTYESYKRNINKHISSHIGNITLSKLKPLDLTNLYNNLENLLSAKTILYIHKIIHKALGQALKWELVTRNVADCVTPPTPEKYVAIVLDEQEVQILLKEFKNTDIYIAVLIAVGAGLRRGEILALTWDCVDFVNKTLLINKSAIPTKNELTLKKPKTNHSIRQVSISDTIISELQELKYKQNIQKRFLKNNYINNNLVFCKENGEYYSPTKLNHTFKHIIDSLNIPKIRFHDLRHTHASLLLNMNVNFKAISERLGHSTIGITLDTYSHVYDATNKQIANDFDKYLSVPKEISKRLAN